MNGLGAVELSNPAVTTASTQPVLSLDAIDSPSGSVERLVGRIYRNLGLLQGLRRGGWEELFMAEEDGSVTDQHASRALGRALHESVSLYENVAAFLELHDILIPVVYRVEPEQARRVTEILFTKKLVKRLE